MFSAKLRILTCFVFFLAINAEDADLYRTVETKNGQIRGIRLKTLLQNMDYFAFRGIPYAEKPIGELRFKVKTFFLQKTVSIHYYIIKLGTETGWIMETQYVRCIRLWRCVYSKAKLLCDTESTKWRLLVLEYFCSRCCTFTKSSVKCVIICLFFLLYKSDDIGVNEKLAVMFYIHGEIWIFHEIRRLVVIVSFIFVEQEADTMKDLVTITTSVQIF